MWHLRHVLIIFTLLPWCSCGTNCQTGWTIGYDSCYLFHLQPLTWTEASHYCRSLGAHLARIESEGEHNDLVAILQHYTGNYWLDGIDDVNEGDWRWASNYNERISPTFWAPGEPNQHVHGVNEDCMDTQRGLWNDERCHYRQYSICEKD